MWFAIIMMMIMGMHEVGIEQELVIGQQIARCIVCDDFALFKNIGIIGDIRYGVEVVRGDDDGFFARTPINQKINDTALAFGVEGSGRFVE